MNIACFFVHRFRQLTALHLTGSHEEPEQTVVMYREWKQQWKPHMVLSFLHCENDHGSLCVYASETHKFIPIRVI